MRISILGLILKKVLLTGLKKGGTNNCPEEHCFNSSKKSANVSTASEELLCSLKR